ncbi:MAG: hypothetical protein ACKV2U_04795 [Bryobacteraceae bacterium]
MSKEAFGSRRVTEALKAVGEYLDNAAQIAAGVQPGGTVKLNIEDIPATPSPRLTEVQWVINAQKSHVIRLDQLTKPCTIEASGENLSKIVTFKLVRGRFFFVAGKDKIKFLKDPKGKVVGFTASIAVTGPSLGSYDACIESATGQIASLSDACSIEAPVAAAQAIQLGPINPSPSRGGENWATLVVLRGQPSEYELTDIGGKSQPGWPVKEITKQEFQNKCKWTKDMYGRYKSQLLTLYKGARIVHLKIDIPTPTDGVFCLVAKSTAPPSKGKQTFFVEK